MTIVASLVDGSARSARQASIPSMRGMSTSRNTIAGCSR